MLRALKGTGSMTPCSQRGGIKLYYRIIYTIQWELRG
uniref:Uncharacterized protein n=1 Tax=Triticum urartu TaxID=4572 RepID=A0A8R7UP87_TRIUA